MQDHENVCWFVICVRAGFFPLCEGGRGTEGKSLNDNSIFELKSSPSAKFIYESTFYSEGCREVSLLHNYLLFNTLKELKA